MNIPAPIPFKAEAPQPLLREIPKGEAYPVDALGPLQAVVEAVEDITQAPIAIAAQSALSVASLAIQGFADVETLGGDAPCSLFCLTIAESGERKSSCDRLLMKGLREYEREQLEIYNSEFILHEAALGVWAEKHKNLTKEAGGMNADKAIKAIALLEAMPPRPVAPIYPSLTASEPTFEGLLKLYEIGKPALGLFSDEAGGFIGGHAMNSDNRLKTMAGLSNLWNAETINRTRAGDGATTYHGRRLATHLMVQPVAAYPFLSDPQASGQGFLARFLITHPPSNIGTRMYRTPQITSRHTIDQFACDLDKTLRLEQPTTANGKELTPARLTLSDDARCLLGTYHNAVEAAQAAGGEFEGARSFGSKAIEQAARIAGVLTLWSDTLAHEVKAEAMGWGIELSGFYLREAKRLADAGSVTEETDKAEKLRKWLIESWTENEVMVRDIVQKGPSQLRETKAARAALGALEQHGWVEQLPAGTVVRGAARSSAYKIVRIENVL